MRALSKYEVCDEIGSGPRAKVFRARHAELGIEVAVKQLRAALDPQIKQRTLAATDRWVQARHDHLLVVRDIDRARNWIVSDVMRGNFAALVAAGPLPPEWVGDVLAQCLRALDFLHTQRNCLHLNIKPSNLLYDEQRRVRLADGYLPAIGPIIELPPSGSACKYLAPELLGEGGGAVGPATDLYCLGFVVLEMLIGPRFTWLFRSVCSAPGDIEAAWSGWHRDFSETAPSVAEQLPNAPQPLASIVERLVAKPQAQRYATARDVLDDLVSGTCSRAGRSKTFLESRDEVGDFAADAGAAEIYPVAPMPPNRPPAAALASDAGNAYAFAASSGLTEAPSAAPPAAAAKSIVAGLIPRPTCSVVLKLASGPRAGEMKGLEGNDLVIGDADNSQWRFLPQQYPAVRGRKVVLHCDRHGWKARCDDGRGLIVNNQWVARGAALRSGDIVRLSLDGPDFQVILQNAGERPLIEMVGTYFSPHAGPIGPAGTPQVLKPADRDPGPWSS